MKKTIYILTLILSTNFSLFSQESNWTDLFNGENLEGWHTYNKNIKKKIKKWYVENGELILDSNNDNISRGNDIVTNKKYTNFELSIEWNIPFGGNSGVMFGVEEIKGMSQPWQTGPEIQVLDNDNFEDGNSLAIHLAPALYDLKAVDQIEYNSYGNWNHLLLKIDHDNNLGSITFNGNFVYSFALSGPEWDKMVSKSKFNNPSHPSYVIAPLFGKFKTGKIALQDHGFAVRYRNIKIREL
mgnify:FL=1|tara:strand:+ start:3064 stop:3786 length:723 start_codon:yes stop_codon:yes gene_type:complete